MGRKQAMMPMAGRGSSRRVVTILVGLALLGLVIRDPAGAAHTVQQVATWADSVLSALTSFGSALSK